VLRPRPAASAAVLAALALAVSFLLPPLGAGGATRPLAAATVALATLGLATGRRATPWLRGAGRLPAGGALGLGVIALVTGRSLWLELLPAFVWACIACVFIRSLGEPPSVFERLARLVDRRAPDFIAPYCWVVTGLYAALFAVVAAAIGWLALTGAHEAWRWFSGVGAWLALAAFQAGEVVARKLHFRHYGRNLLDRVLARLFPSENTPRGRRSEAYLRGLAERDAGASRS